MSTSQSTRAPAFAALHQRGYRNFFIASTCAATGDSIEHVVSYWVLYQQFQSPTLGGVAVLTHWLPFLFFSVYAGALTDRFAHRRLIQISQGLMMSVSLGWAITILTGTLTETIAIVLLCFHGLFGVFTVPAAQLVIHEMVQSKDLQSAVRLNSTTRQLGLLLGPAIGGTLMLAISPTATLLFNALMYLPIVIWGAMTRYGSRDKPATPSATRASGFAEIARTLRSVATDRVIASMMILAGAASLFIGNAYQPQMPEFAHDLHQGHDHHAGVLYSLLLSADAIGAITAAIVLESRALLTPHPRTAMILALMWCLALAGFAMSTAYITAVPLMFAAGFFSLSFYAMAQTLVQLRAPQAMRGRIVGLFAMANLGLRAFSGVTIGVLGGFIGIHWSLAASALALLTVAITLIALSLRQRA